MKLSNTPTEALRKELSTITNDIQKTIERAAVILYELRRRNIYHPLMKSPILRFYVEIVGNILSASAVVSLGGNKQMVKAILPLSISRQKEIAAGSALDVVEVTPTGKQITVQREIYHLDNKALMRVFSGAGIRSILDQKKMLGVERNRLRIDGFIVDIDEGHLIIGRIHVSPLDLVRPLRKLGFRVEALENV